MKEKSCGKIFVLAIWIIKALPCLKTRARPGRQAKICARGKEKKPQVKDNDTSEESKLSGDEAEQAWPTAAVCLG